MSVDLLELPRTPEGGEESIDWRRDDPAIVARTTASLGSYGWRWLLFLNEHGWGVLEPRAPFWND
jgi:hypothetical protein